MPRVQRLHENYADNPKVVILALNVGDDNDRVRSWWKEKEFGFRTLNDADSIVGDYEIKAFPSSILIGPDGKVIKARVGSVTTLRKELERVLDE